MNALIPAPSLLIFSLSWYADWLWGLPLIVLTVLFHAIGLLLILEKLERLRKDFLEHYGYHVGFVMIVGGSALWAVLLHGAESVIWAAAYLYTDALPDYHDAAVYSLGALTTYGHVDMHLESRWQLLGALEALDGVLLFGLTAAFLVGIIQKIHELKNEQSR
jgi:hypothetical protein